MAIGICLKRDHRCSIPYFVVKIFLTYKTTFPIFAPTKRKFLSIQFDKARGVVICSTVDPRDYYFEFPMGVYHTFDYPFYFFNVRQNAADRIQQYFTKN